MYFISFLKLFVIVYYIIKKRGDWMFQFEYENTIEDFIRGEEIRHSLSFKRVFWDIIFSARIFPVFLLLYGIYCISVGINIPGILMLILAVALPLVVKFISPKSRRRVYRNSYKKIIKEYPYVLDKKVFQMSDKNIRILFSTGKVSTYSLDMLKKGVVSENAIYLYINKDYNLLTVIPYSAFKSGEDKYKFSEYIKRI